MTQTATLSVDGYFDPRFQTHAIKLLPGEYRIDDHDVMLVTVLGSCVAACINDPQRGIGGMNHFMLPDARDANDGGSARYGAFAMEVLVNELLKHGATRERLQAKVFGGGAVLPGFTTTNIGAQNASFVLRYLAAEQIPVLAQDLGDVCPRRVHYFPRSGRVMVKRLATAQNAAVAAEEQNYRSRLRQVPVAGDVELF